MPIFSPKGPSRTSGAPQQTEGNGNKQGRPREPRAQRDGSPGESLVGISEEEARRRPRKTHDGERQDMAEDAGREDVSREDAGEPRAAHGAEEGAAGQEPAEEKRDAAPGPPAQDVGGEEEERPGRGAAVLGGPSAGKFIIPQDQFGPFLPYIQDPQITDVDYNGRDLWVTDINNNKVRKTDECGGALTPEFITRFVRAVANAKSLDLNQKSPVMEAETKELRISVLHDSIATSGTSICIRKTPPFQRITELYAVNTKYTTVSVLALLANCIRAHMNIVVAGQPRAGKTELAKFLGCYIPDSERVVTIEDVMEWRFLQLKPNADCIELQTRGDFGYTEGIIASLKQNPDWIMIAETRGSEISALINGFSTGVKGITTLHTDSVEKIPQRMLNMVDDTAVESRFLGNIYEFIDVGIMVTIRKDEETGRRFRQIQQVGFFSNVDGEHKCNIIVDDGKVVSRELPSYVAARFKSGGVTGDVFLNSETDSRIISQGGDPQRLREEELGERAGGAPQQERRPAKKAKDRRFRYFNSVRDDASAGAE